MRALGAVALFVFVRVVPAAAFNYVADANGTYWGIQDDAPPRVDTGSIRATQIAPGLNGAFSTTINGFAGIRVSVQTTPAPRFDGAVMRGFGLVFDGVDRFRTTQSVDMGGVLVSRSVWINRGANWGRWLDTFTNTTGVPLTVRVAFGGQSGIGASGPNSSVVVKTSSGDPQLDGTDNWVEVASPVGEALSGGPQATVVGKVEFAGNWLNRLNATFSRPIALYGHEGNFQAYGNVLTLPPGESQSLLHFVVLGEPVTAATSERVRAEVEAAATRLAAVPDVSGLTPAEICGIANFDVTRLCADRNLKRVAQPLPRRGSGPKRRRATMSWRKRSVSCAPTWRRAARRHRKSRRPISTALPITTPVSLDSCVRNRCRRCDGPGQSGGRGAAVGEEDSAARYPDRDQESVRHVRHGDHERESHLRRIPPRARCFPGGEAEAAGAVIIGKTALEEYATSGYYSNDAWGQVWNVFDPSRSAIASSGGSGSALAASLAAGALGSQTGDSLYGPSSAASLVTLRGTDGLESGSGIMPLNWLTDFGGAMARSVSDLADMLNVVAGTDPDDPATAPADAHIPADWRSVLDVNALRGKRIGYIPSAWVDPFGTTATIAAEKAALRYLEQAGAILVQMGVTVGGEDTPPAIPDTTPGDLRSEGWMQYIDRHPELAAQGFAIKTAVDVNCSQKKVAYVRADAASCSALPAPRMTAAEIQAKREYRLMRQAAVKAWMDTAGGDRRGVDAIVYPGLLSEISVNDGGGARPSFGRRDTPSAANGVPTVAFPAGFDEHGQPIGIQLLGRAWDDAKLVGMAFAFEQVAEAAGHGHVRAMGVPPLTYRAGK
jgi:amidase